MPDSQNSKKVNFLQSRKAKFLLAFITLILFIFIGTLGFFSWASPASITFPKQDHAHFRLQYVFLGQNENFGSSKYQVDYVKGVCSAGLTDSLIHFHDNTDQIVHLHWQKITGGQILKFYGLNQIGGLDDTLGFQMNGLNLPTKAPIHVTILPKPRTEDKFFVYTGEPSSWQKKDFKDFVRLDLETFFGVESIIRKNIENAEKISNSKTNSKNFGTITVSADTENNQITNSNQTKSTPKTEEELKKINNFLGNVLIFVQPNEPTKEEIQAKFDNLTPLHDSVCGG